MSGRLATVGTGAVWSSTVTVKLEVPTEPSVHITVVVPTGKNEPDG